MSYYPQTEKNMNITEARCLNCNNLAATHRSHDLACMFGDGQLGLTWRAPADTTVTIPSTRERVIIEPPKEVRIVDPKTGGEKGKKGIELAFIDPLALEELGRVASIGAQKYAAFNFAKGYSWMLSVNAMFRHILRFLAGEDRDLETGCLHIAHAAWHGLALTTFILRSRGTDDRIK